MMADGQDIDALLVDALYGELDPQQRARLDAHLAAHPSVHGELEALRGTREWLRDAKLDTTLLDPPPAVSAQLLQMAARRAPRSGLAAWFSRWLGPVMLHPGLAAAAALVVVGGAAGVMYSAGRFGAARPPARSVAIADRGAEMGAVEAPAAAAPAKPEDSPNGPPPVVSVDSVGLTEAQQQQLNDSYDRFTYGGVAGNGEAPSSSTAGHAKSSRDPARTKALAQAPTSPEPKASVAQMPSKKDERADTSAPKRPVVAAGNFAAPPPAPAPQTAAAGYLEVDRGADRTPQIRDLDGTPIEGKAAVGSASREENERSRSAPSADAETGAVPPPAAPSAPSDADPKNDAVWAREQHARATKLAGAGECEEVRAITAAIQRRAAAYYQASVRNDRALRLCSSSNKAKAPAKRDVAK